MLRDSWRQEQKVNINPIRLQKRHAQSTMEAQNPQPRSQPFIFHVISFNSVQQTIIEILLSAQQYWAQWTFQRINFELCPLIF